MRVAKQLLRKTNRLIDFVFEDKNKLTMFQYLIEQLVTELVV